VFAGLLVGGAAALAQDVSNQQSIPIGEADLFPSLRIDYVTNDNVGLLSRDEIDGSAVVVRPDLVFVADRRLLDVQARYLGRYSRGDEGALDWADHLLGTSVEAELDSRRRINLSATFERGHEPLGSEFTRGQGDRFDEPVTYDWLGFGGNFSYGAAGAAGRINVGARFVQRDYNNLAEVTDGRDRRGISTYGRFGYRISGDTRAQFELRYTDVTYDNARLDRTELSALTGMSFAATGALSGAAFIGVQDISRDDEGLEGSTLLIVESELVYRPVDYAVLTLDLRREIDDNARALDAAGGDESIVSEAILTWDHDWSSRVSTQTFGRVTLREDACPFRDTATTEAGLEIDFAVRRWLSFGLNGAIWSRGSDDCPGSADADELDFDRTTLGAFVRATL